MGINAVERICSACGPNRYSSLTVGQVSALGDGRVEELTEPIEIRVDFAIGLRGRKQVQLHRLSLKIVVKFIFQRVNYLVESGSCDQRKREVVEALVELFVFPGDNNQFFQFLLVAGSLFPQRL